MKYLFSIAISKQIQLCSDLSQGGRGEDLNLAFFNNIYYDKDKIVFCSAFGFCCHTLKPGLLVEKLVIY